jgi:hypothetical protein
LGNLIQDPSVLVSRNLPPATDDKLRVKGLFQVVNMSPVIDPIANGFQVTIYGQSGTPLLSFFVPPGAQADSQSPGWKVNSSGTKWSFKDRDGVLIPGIQRATVAHKVKLATGIFAVSASGKNFNFHIDQAELPLRLDVVLGGVPQAAAGQCARGLFNPASGDRPRCQVRSEGDATGRPPVSRLEVR